MVGHRLFFFDTERGQVRAELVDPEGIAPRLVAMGPGGKHMAVAGFDGTLTVWRVRDRAIVFRQRAWTQGCAWDPAEYSEDCGGPYCIFHAEWSPKGTSAMLCGSTGCDWIDVSHGKRAALPCRDFGICGEYSPDGELFALRESHPEAVAVIRPPSLTPIVRIDGARDGIWDSKGRLLAVTRAVDGHTYDSAAEMWDVAARRRVWRRASTSVWSWTPANALVGSEQVGHVVIDAESGAVLAQWRRAFTTCGSGAAQAGDALALLDDDTIQL